MSRLLLLLTIGCAHAANWPQWRGPAASGVSDETALPAEWSADKNIEWKTELPGEGSSQPIVWGDRIFLTADIAGDGIEGAKAPVHHINGEVFKHPDASGAERRHTLVLIAVDRKSGKILWRKTAHDGPVYDDKHKKGSYASPTPLTDGKLVYAYFGTEGLFAYDFNGELKWKMSPGKMKTAGMGPGTSPVIDGDLIFLQCDQTFSGEGSVFLALNRHTGKEAWTVARKNRITWATPVIVDAKGGKQLIASGAESTIAYDPKTGKEIWKSEGVVGHAIPSAVVGHGLVIVSAGYPEKRAYALRADGSVAWKYEKGTAYVPSPILYGDYVYLMTDKGLLTCLDAKTGELKYEGGRPSSAAGFMASPVAYDGKILLTSEDGDTYVIKAGPKHEILAKNSLGEPVFASPAISDGHIYIRARKHLYAIQR